MNDQKKSYEELEQEFEQLMKDYELYKSIADYNTKRLNKLQKQLDAVKAVINLVEAD